MADVSDDLINEAFEWIARSSDDDFSAFEQAQLDAWLDRDPAHRTAFELAKMTWDKVEQIPKSEYSADWFKEILDLEAQEHESFSRPLRPFLSPRRLLLVTAAVAVTTALLVFIRPAPNETIQPTYYRSEVAKTTDVRLSDGSVVTLGAESRISVVFTDDSRQIVLERGEAFFDVISAPNQPFVVTSDWVTVTVVGTTFEISQTPDSTIIAVLEGVVSVEAGKTPVSDEPAAVKKLTSGQQVKGTLAGLSDIRAVDTEAVGAWRRGELVYVSAPLSEILADADRYYPGTIEIMDRGVESLTLSLIVEAKDTDGLLNTLESALPIRVNRLNDGTVLIGSDR